MTTYVVRIELHGPGCDYPQLHNWMQSKGFKTSILGGGGQNYKLPTATYQVDYNSTEADLCTWLTQNLPSCGSVPAAWIFVVKSAGMAWRLSPIAKAA